MEHSSEPYSVYLGVWTNWSRGAIMGKTVTMSRDDANFLIAFVAFYVAFVGRRLWRIFCFACHSVVSSRSQQGRDGIYHQHQLVMRNSSTATNGFISIVQVLWAWRLTQRRLWHVLPITLLLAAVCSVSFIVASGFSSRISTVAGDEVLIRSNRCGYLLDGDNLDTYARIYTPHLSKLFVNAANYAQECYGLNSSGLLSCNTFVKQALPFTVDTNAPCPFEPGLCRTNDSNIRVDLKAPATTRRLLFCAFMSSLVIPLVTGSPPFLVGMWNDDAP